MFLLLGMSVSGDVEWHFLLQLLLPHYINLFQSDVHSLIDKLFSSGSHRFTDAVKCAIFLCLGSLGHVGQQSVRHGRVRFNASLVRLGKVCHRSTDVRHGLVFFNISVVPWSFKSCRSSARHRVVFSTLGLYACPYSQAGQQIVHQGLACFNLHFFQIYSSVAMVEFSWGVV